MNSSKPFVRVAKKVLLGRACIVAMFALLGGAIAYSSALYNESDMQLKANLTVSFKNQFYEGKACGLLTSKEASKLLGQEVKTAGSIIAADSPSANDEPGRPRIDACSHTSINSSDAYIDVVLKMYDNKESATKYYDQQIEKVFNATNKDAAGFGDKLIFASGVFYLLKDADVVEVSGAKPAGQELASRETFGFSILQTITNKLY